jgi:hypothetical protein
VTHEKTPRNAGQQGGAPRKPLESSGGSEPWQDAWLRRALAGTKVLFLGMAFFYTAFHWSDLSEWLSTIKHGEVFGLKFDRKVADEKVAKLESSRITQEDRGFAQGAIDRAARVGSAVAGARILWLDTNLENNVVERQILEAMSISIQRALSLQDAQALARQAASDREPYDLIISNVSREPGTGPLIRCPVYYSAIPRGVPWSRTLGEFNAAQNSSPRLGFAFAEWLANDPISAPAYMREQRPKLIFYSASNGGIASSICARTVTNYADVLLQNVVSALEESRWDKLPPLPKATKEVTKPPPGVSGSEAPSPD